jgi:UDP-N-acetylmuramate dehydrogenase
VSRAHSPEPRTSGRAELPVAELARRLGRDRLLRDASLAPLTTFRIGGPADFLYHARSADELAQALQAARELDVPWFLLGIPT